MLRNKVGQGLYNHGLKAIDSGEDGGTVGIRERTFGLEMWVLNTDWSSLAQDNVR